MKNIIRLRTLIAFSFILFALPFIQICSDRSIERYATYEAEPAEEPIVEETFISGVNNQHETLDTDENPNENNSVSFIKNESSSYKVISLEKLKEKEKKAHTAFTPYQY